MTETILGGDTALPADDELRLFAIADRLRVLARQSETGTQNLRSACEGAVILGYLAAAQIALWPAFKHSAEAAVKERLITIINERASRGDPAHMQAAIRHLFSAAIWPAFGWRPTATVVLEPSWIPMLRPVRTGLTISLSREGGGTATCRPFAFNPCRWRDEDGHCREQITPHERTSRDYQK